jgi:undecaprenyl-diphosphatase
MANLLSVIQSWDTSLFHWINNSWRNEFFDWLMPTVSRFQNFQYILLVLVILLLWKGGVKGRIFVAAALVLLAITDRGNSDVVKHLFVRPRPYDTLVDIHVYLKQHWMITTPQMVARYTGTRSFPSTHAVNVWAMAVLAGLFYRRWSILFYCLAALICLSRVYVGHHYPLDVIGGATLGAAVAVAFYHGVRYAFIKLDKNQRWVWKAFPRT